MILIITYVFSITIMIISPKKSLKLKSMNGQKYIFAIGRNRMAFDYWNFLVAL